MTARGALAICLALGSAIALGSTSMSAQRGRPKADLVATAPAGPAKPGTLVTLVLGVRLPADVHVQSDAPRDPTLIPTALTIAAPEGVTVERIRYPKATDLPQPGRSEALAVFGPALEIAVDVRLKAGLAAGALVVPATFRYQACDASTCFPPTRAEVSWTLAVAP